VRPINLPDLSGLTLLVVEDDDDSLDLLRNVLNAYGAHVLEARTGIGALAYVNTTPKIDVLLTDLSMPTMDGIELLCKIRAHPTRNSLPAIALTGYYEKYAGTNTTGFDALLKKPVDFDELARTIKALVRPR